MHLEMYKYTVSAARDQNFVRIILNFNARTPLFREKNAFAAKSLPFSDDSQWVLENSQ